MKVFNRHINKLSRLMMGLFLAQVLVAGFCVIAPQMHRATATEIDHHYSASAAHCDKDMSSMNMDYHASHDGVCEHCDSPDELLTKVSTPDYSLALSLVTVILLSDWDAHSDIVESFAYSNSPPKSASLLYNTTKRIRI